MVEGLQFVVVVGGALVALVLLALLINLFRAMTRFALAVGVVLAFVAVCAVALSFVSWPTLPSPSVEIVHEIRGEGGGGAVGSVSTSTGTSAAVTVRRFAVGLLAAVVVGPVGVVLVVLWWQGYQRRARLQETQAQAQMYALMSGQRSQLAAGMGVQRGQQGGNVIVVGGGQQEPVQQVGGGGDLWEFTN